MISYSKVALLAASALILAACSSTKPEGEGGTFGQGGLNNGGINGRAGAGAGTPGSMADFTVNVGDKVLFEEDSSELTSKARATLDSQAQWLTKYNTYSFTIEGHADERGTREYNLALGSRRSQAVKDYLTARGMNTSRFRTISYGKERPVSSCNDVSCWSQNRRAVTVLGQ